MKKREFKSKALQREFDENALDLAVIVGKQYVALIGDRMLKGKQLYTLISGDKTDDPALDALTIQATIDQLEKLLDLLDEKQLAHENKGPELISFAQLPPKGTS
jgi:hypothetical protein